MPNIFHDYLHYLQYTLLLLILHYLLLILEILDNLQYTLLLLILFSVKHHMLPLMYLQYTLLLLILEKNKKPFWKRFLFTIHFATINTLKNSTDFISEMNLQYTLLLLIQSLANLLLQAL